MTKKILTIKFKFNDSLSDCQFKIKIYNKNNDLILYSLTDNFGCIELPVSYHDIYKINICDCKYKTNNFIILYINSDTKEEITLILNKPCKNHKHLITINFTDRYYNGLPITKGSVILRPKNI